VGGRPAEELEQQRQIDIDSESSIRGRKFEFEERKDRSEIVALSRSMMTRMQVVVEWKAESQMLQAEGHLCHN
jgi:hypothetical protein